MSTLPDHFALMGGPDRVRTVVAEDSFRFHCHPGVSCFTECCRELELALSPYDIIRLKQALGLSSPEFLERYGIIEFGPEDLYPKVYLAMVDDGRASCPFVGASGCQVYDDRPGACRTYPLGRGASLDQNSQSNEHFIIIHENHCQGFDETQSQTVRDWQHDQGTSDYNRFNDLLLTLLPHASSAAPRLSDDEATLFIDTLYNLDLFRNRLCQEPQSNLALPTDDAALLSTAILWLQKQWQPAR